MAKRTDYRVVNKVPAYSNRRKKDGTKVKAGTFVTYADGGKDVLLTPAGRAGKFASELKTNVRRTNAGQPKCDKDGVVMGLTKSQRAFRAGYLTARSDEAKAYNAKKRGAK